MKKTIINILTSLLLIVLFINISCSKENLSDSISTQYQDNTTKTDINITLKCFGGYSTLKFNTKNEWKLINNSSWITTSNNIGKPGDIKIQIRAKANTSKYTRSEKLELITGNNRTNILVSQKNISGGYVNNWISDFMSYHYLWNDEFNTIKNKLDYSVSPEDFLNSAVSSMTTNSDDGYKKNGEREYYSYIKSGHPYERSIVEKADDYGIGFLKVKRISDQSSYLCFEICFVYPSSSADVAGIKRGTIITKVNGENIMESNYYNLYNKLIGEDESNTITLEKNELEETDNEYKLGDTSTITITKTNYESNPIIKNTTFDINGKKIGYLAYTSFDMKYDDNLIEVFSKFKKNGISDLILDLRYNGGGFLCSSLLLATAIIGEKYKGDVYCHLTYNKERTANGEEDYQYIGNDNDYSKVKDALACSPQLNNLYVLCSENTASASELIINGLRGLNINVKLIGKKTNGKNVGMEIAESDNYKDFYNFKNILYNLAAITFYSANAKDFKDYSNGFDVDFDIDEDYYRFGNFGDYKTDPLTAAAVYNIENDIWPSTDKARCVNSKSILNCNVIKSLERPRTLKGTIFHRNTNY